MQLVHPEIQPLLQMKSGKELVKKLSKLEILYSAGIERLTAISKLTQIETYLLPLRNVGYQALNNVPDLSHHPGRK